MPKGIRKSNGRGGQQFTQQNAQADVTVYHFANAEPGRFKSGRMSKAASTWSPVKVKQMSGPSSEAVENDNALAWYERDISTFDLLSDSDECSEPDHGDEENKSELSEQEKEAEAAKKPVGRRRRKKLMVERLNDPGEVYPLDLWFLIGNWISPEQVGTFARICRGTHIVTHCARFWYRLYDRCYHSDAVLPTTLQPQSMERVHGLRARVIRAIFNMYTPFQQRLQVRAPFEQDIDSLKGACCTLMWYQTVKTHWYFYFKFLLPHNDKFACPLVVKSERSSSRKISPLHQDANIHHNTEDGYCVLQIVTQNFIPLPSSLMGQMLAKSALSVSHGMRYHKLKLTFSPQHYTPQGNRSEISSGTTVVMDPVLNSYVLNWWDPKYPHQPV